MKKAENSHRWKGGKYLDHQGYVFKYCPGHHRAKKGTHVREHILIAEKVLGRKITEPICVHHSNGNGSDNINKNLVICENRGYHNLLHKRYKAYIASGNANWLKCRYCKRYDDPNNLYIQFQEKSKDYSVGRHRECHTEYEKARLHANN